MHPQCQAFAHLMAPPHHLGVLHIIPTFFPVGQDQMFGTPQGSTATEKTPDIRKNLNGALAAASTGAAGSRVARAPSTAASSEAQPRVRLTIGGLCVCVAAFVVQKDCP